MNIQTVNIDGNLLKVIRAKSTKMKGIDNNKPYDFDLYEIEARSPLATRELSLIVDFINKEVSGDIVAFGSWYDLDQSTVIDLLRQLIEVNQLLLCLCIDFSIFIIPFSVSLKSGTINTRFPFDSLIAQTLSI